MKSAVSHPNEKHYFNIIPHESPPYGPWPVGEWTEEPDDVDGFDPMTGYVYAMRRSQFGSWCGYVCLPRRHPWYGLAQYDEIDAGVQVHGGITFSREHLGRDEPQEGAWWVGFDCGHFLDIQPGLRYFSVVAIGGEAYRNLDYVRQEVLSLAGQLRAVEVAVADETPSDPPGPPPEWMRESQ